MKSLKLLGFLFLSFNVFSQQIPRVVLEDSTYLQLKKIDVKTDIVGNMASTSYTLTFYNATDRVLEGELAFPLGQGQAVTNFAMDVNGKMRDAVIVEKELGRVAYENTIRQTIDPGLLTMTKGNNYKARVYPIPAKGFKTLQIVFEQELRASNNSHVYEVPFDFSESLDFSFEIAVFNPNITPKIIDGNKYGLKFKKDDLILKAVVAKENLIPNEHFKMELPIVATETVSTYYDYFNVYKYFEPKTRFKAKPKRIALFWDASYSMQYRKINEELLLLDSYLKYLNDVTIEFTTFNNAKSDTKIFEIENGNWKGLKKEIETVIYDGGTSYLELKNTTADDILFFTDGMFNLGGIENVFTGAVYTINSVNSANHEFLDNLATKFSGKYLNLNLMDANEGLKHLKTQTFQFLGVASNGHVSEIYPKTKTNINSDFSISGKFKQDTTIELQFGFGNEVTETIEVSLRASGFNKLVKRLWAKKKLQFLNFNKEENREEIIGLAKKHHLITDYTSMIILDRIEDYIRYNIEPPHELRSQFKQMMVDHDEMEAEKQQDIKDRKEELFEDYEDLISWYRTDYPIVKKLAKTHAATVQNNLVTHNPTATNTENVSQNRPNVTTENTAQTNNETTSNPTLDHNKNIISGIVLDEDNLPLPGANVLVKGFSRGAVTNFDGYFSVNAEIGDVLSFSYIGFVSQEHAVQSNDNVSIKLAFSSEALDEVVVVGYGVVRKQSVTASITTITTESVSNGVSSALQGQISGVAVAQSGATDAVMIRGAQTTNSSNSPMYIVDGVVVSGDDSKHIPNEDIESIHVLKESAAISLYGSRASNGIVIITTKDGIKTNKPEIETLNKKVNEVIQFKPWTPESDYIKILLAENSVESAYEKYLELRNRYRNTPTFFIDVADYFDSKQQKELAIKILTNLAEIDLDNHEILRALAYKLDYFKNYKLALHVYEEILKLRPEEPQSTRDLALANENVGNYQKAFDLLYKLIDGKLLEKDTEERFYGIEHIAFIEACHLIKQHKNEITLSTEQEKIIKPMTLDIRVVIDWNHDNTDLDLWVENPNKESINYKNKTTDYGDRISEDLTQGYGPEEYMLKKAVKGNYNVLIDYFGDDVQKISGPTILKVTIFKNYGKKNETKETRTLRLDKEEDELEVGTIDFQ